MRGKSGSLANLAVGLEDVANRRAGLEDFVRCLEGLAHGRVHGAVLGVRLADEDRGHERGVVMATPPICTVS